MKKIVGILGKYKWMILTIGVVNIGCAMIEIATSEFLRHLINTAMSNKPFIWFNYLILALSILILGSGFNFYVVYLTENTGAKFLGTLRKESVGHFLKVKPDIMEKKKFGDMMTRFTSDMDNLSMFVEKYLKDSLYVPVMFVFFSIYLLSIHWLLYIACLLPIVILVPLSTKLMAPIKEKQKKYAKQLGDLNDHIIQVSDARYEMKIYELEEKFYQNYFEKLKKLLLTAQENDRIQYRIEPLSYMIIRLPIVICLFLGSYLSLEGRIEIGDLVAFLTLLKLFINPMMRAYQLVVNSKTAMASLERILDIYEIEEELQFIQESWEDKKENTRAEIKEEIIEAARDDSLEGEVYRMKHCRFAYQDKEVVYIDSLTIQKGKQTAIVGESGSGKTTLLKLLYGYYTTYEGSLCMQGKEMRLENMEDIRKRIGVVVQDPFLFPVSVYDNIAIGKSNPSQEEVIEAARKAEIHDYIMSLPKGYETRVGEKGVNMSGGQKQRMTLARAILKNAEILLMDEPTSALDQKSEALILKSVNNICKERKLTLITIAHKLKTVEDYHEIIMLKDGKVIEKGNHKELMSKEAYYADYYKKMA